VSYEVILPAGNPIGQGGNRKINPYFADIYGISNTGLTVSRTLPKERRKHRH
jgi:hypothetical protein